MRYPAELTAERHQRIITAASEMLRRSGFDGVSVAAVMKASGLTHGGFYTHFDSKDAMAAAGIEAALAEMLDLVDHAGDTSTPMATFVEQYLSQQHRDEPEHGCAISALAPEIARTRGSIRDAFTRGVEKLIDHLTTRIVPAADDPRTEAITMLCTLVGTLTLARAVDDPGLSAQILATGRAGLTRSSTN